MQLLVTTKNALQAKSKTQYSDLARIVHKDKQSSGSIEMVIAGGLNSRMEHAPYITITDGDRKMEFKSWEEFSAKIFQDSPVKI